MSSTNSVAAAPEPAAVEPAVIAAEDQRPLSGEGEAQSAPTQPRFDDPVTGDAGGYSSAPRRLHYKFDAQVSGIYDDNINFDETDRVKDYYCSVAPRAIVGFGDVDDRQENYVRLEYAPHLLVFVDHSENDAFEQAVFTEGQYRFERLQIRLRQDVQVIDSADVAYRTSLDEINNRLNLDVSGRTRLNLFDTNITASYDVSSKTFFTVSLNNSVLDYGNSALLDSQTEEGTFYLNYRYGDKLTIGVGGGGGIEHIDPPTPDQTFEHGTVRLAYEVRTKLRIAAEAGGEIRQFAGDGGGAYVTPVVELSALYLPFDGTEIRLNLRRRTQTSAALIGQDYSTTTIDFGARQRFLRRFVLGLTAGYANDQYFETIDSSSTTRKDNYYYFAPSVDVFLTRFWSVGGYYLRRENDVSDGGFGFKDNQIGVRAAVAF